MSVDTVKAILLGVAAGVITASLLVLIRQLFYDSFLPWYRQLFYRGIHISGKWFSYSVKPQKFVLELKQDCECLVGKATAILDLPDGIEVDVDTVRTFDVRGSISDRFVTLNLTHTDKTRIGVVSLLLQTEGDGTILKGQSSGYNPALSAIRSHEKTFYRDESRAKREQPQIDIPTEVLKRAVMRAPEAFFPEISADDIEAVISATQQSEQTPAGDVPKAAPEE